jgi:hypothetical protein
MKKLFAIMTIFCALFVASPKADAQLVHNQPGNYCISVDPFDLLISKTLNATYEIKMGSSNSLSIFGSYYNYSSSWSGFGIGASYRWYVNLFGENTKALEGFSFGPLASVGFWKYDAPKHTNFNYDNDVMFSIGIEAAYKWTFSKNFFVEPIARIGFAVNDVNGLGYDPVGGGINIGYTW